jgi:NADPH:quinone reductase-like Zn-dependent oxidoreductase
VLEIVEIELPEPGPGQVRIEVKAAGVNPADLKLLRGQFGRDEAKLPLRFGSEVAGVVTAVGAGAVGPAGPIAVGDEVVCYRVAGGYAGALVVAASVVMPKPPALSWEQGACLLAVGATAFHLLEATGVISGDRVVVHGASGGVGFAAVQLALLRGARVVGTASPAAHERLRAAGAIPVTYGAGLEERIREVFPDGADAALDTVGTDDAIDTSLALVADRSRIATIAAFGRAAEMGIVALGNGPGADPGTELRAGARLPLLELAGSGLLEVVVARTFPLERAAEALELIGTGHPGGKIALLP